jgi:hypothetical protein
MEEDGEDEQIGEEEVLDIAEACFKKIAISLNGYDITIRQLYQSKSLKEDVDGQTIHLIEPLTFVEGLNEIGVTTFSELEIACLLKVLTKPQLENLILLEDLEVIMENFGEDDEEEGVGGVRDSDEVNVGQSLGAQREDRKAKRF